MAISKLRQITKGKVQRTFEFDYFHRTFLLAHMEYLKVAENRLFCLSVSMHLHAQEITLILPIQLALMEKKRRVSAAEEPRMEFMHLRDTEEVFLANNLTARESHKSNACRLVGNFRSPVNEHILPRLLALL